jgi:hypothetical protein
MTDKCELCNGTKVDTVFGGRCEWCDETGKAGGLTPLPNGPLAMLSALVDAVNHGIGVIKISSEGAEHVPLNDFLVELKPFRTLPYGERFKMPGHPHIIMVKIGHNLVADWPVTLYNHKGEPIQSLCCWCHDPGEPGSEEDDCNMDTLVEVVG